MKEGLATTPPTDMCTPQSTRWSSGAALAGADGMMSQAAFSLSLLWELISVEGSAQRGTLSCAFVHEDFRDPTVNMI